MNFFENKRILVIGATGLIGNHLVRRLLDEKAKVIIVGRNEEKIKDVFGNILNNESLSYRTFDISKRIDTDLGIVDIIFHAASPISGNEIKSFPLNVINVNLKGTINCLEYLKAQRESKNVNGKMIIFSSATIYGNISNRDRIVSEEETEIASALDGVETPYSESKRMIEVISHAYNKQFGIESNIIRIGYVYGYSKSSPNTAFYEFIKRAANGENILVNGIGLPKRDNIYVEDVVEGLLAVCKNGKSGEVYNISSGGDCGNFAAIDEIADIVADITSQLINKQIKVIRRYANNNTRKPGIILNNSKLKSLGWKINISIEEGIRKTMETLLKDVSKEGMLE